MKLRTSQVVVTVGMGAAVIWGAAAGIWMLSVGETSIGLSLLGLSTWLLASLPLTIAMTSQAKQTDRDHAVVRGVHSRRYRVLTATALALLGAAGGLAWGGAGAAVVGACVGLLVVALIDFLPGWLFRRRESESDSAVPLGAILSGMAGLALTLLIMLSIGYAIGGWSLGLGMLAAGVIAPLVVIGALVLVKRR